MSKFLTDKQVAERYGVDRSTIWIWAKKKMIPAPKKLSPGCTRWDCGELDEHDRNLTAA